MKKINRFLSLLLAAVMVLTLIPAPVHAAGQASGPERLSQSVVGINPHYADLFSLEDIQAQRHTPAPGAIRPQSTVHKDVESAAVAVRKDMANRENWIYVSFITEIRDFQEAANALYEAIFAHTGNPKDGDSLQWQYGYWKSEDMMRSKVAGGYQFDCVFYVKYYTNAQQEQELDTAVEALLEELDLEGQSDYDKIYTVYKYICDHVTYDYTHLSDPDYYLMYTPYAALINGTSVCQGYALLFYRLMLELGIDCRFISGWGNGGGHGWNIVELDGLYYNLDTTWDAGLSPYWWDYFLNSFWDFLDHERNVEYDTLAFHNQYPIAAESYRKGVEARMDPYVFAAYGNEERSIIWYLNRNGTLELEGEGATHNFAGDQIPYYTFWIDELTGVWVKEGITGLGTNSFTDFYALQTIRFEGDAPVIASNAFSGVTATAYYPADNATWTADKLQNYGGNLTWVAEGGAHIHSYTASVTAPTCTADGFTTYTCACGDSYVSDHTDALGHALGVWETVKAPTASEPGTERRSCSRCSYHEDRTVDPIGNPCGENAYWTFENGTLTITGTGAVQDYRDYDWELDQEYFFERPWDDFSQDVRRIVIGEGITRLGNDAFKYLTNLESVELPSTLTEIGSFVFIHCTALTQITLPEGLQSLGQQCFWNCTSLKTIEIPSTVTFVDANVFEDCKALTDVYFRSDPNLPGFATGNSIFKNCTALKEIRVEEGHLALRSIDGVLYFAWDSGEMALSSYPAGRENADLRIADNTILIEQSALYNNPYLRNVIIPDTVTKIGNGAFMACYGLQTVKFEGTVPEIQPNAFWGANLTIYYPTNDPSWDDRDQWSADHLVGPWGSMNWVSYCRDHHYEAVITAPTCTEPGFTTCTCSICGECYVTDHTDALGHEYADGACIRCGEYYSPFTDVRKGQFYYEPVLWAVENGITTGASADTFNPNGQCQRAQVVTFLWRAAGCPEPSSTENPFVDVKARDFYYKAVLWAVEMGITNGIDATHFGPTENCNRAQVVTFLWRAMGSPTVNAADCPFTDVASGAWYEAPILWAVENGVTNGMSADTFGTGTVCNRAQVVTFLYRTYVN